MWDEFAKRDVVAIAVAQEDKDLESHGRFHKSFRQPIPFEIVCDVDRKKTPHIDRTTIYWIDKRGVVREIFPAMIHMRPSWKAVLNRMDELTEATRS